MMYRVQFTLNRNGDSWIAPVVYTNQRFAEAFAKSECKDGCTATVVETTETSPMAEITPLGYKYLDGKEI